MQSKRDVVQANVYLGISGRFPSKPASLQNCTKFG
jgi:hypothetical protein